MTRRTLRRRWPLATLLALASSLFLLLAATGSASAATVVNGGFETGSLSGWSQQNKGAGQWFALEGTSAPYTSEAGEHLGEEIAELEEELEGVLTEEDAEEIEEELEAAIQDREEGLGTVLAPFEGRFDAVADEHNPSSMILYQEIALEPGQTHQLSMYLNYHSFAPIFAPDSLESNKINEEEEMLLPPMMSKMQPRAVTAAEEEAERNQQVRVDVLRAGAPLKSVRPADVLATVFATKNGAAQQIPWTHLTADLSPFAGQTVRIRVAAVDTEFYLNAGVDAVSIASAPIAPPVPSNVFSFGKKKKNAKNGSATLTVNVPGPGTLSLVGVSSGKGAKASVSAAKAKKPKKPKNVVKPASATATAAGAISLAIKPTGAAKKYLKAKGALSAKVAVTFTPTGGSANTVTTTVPLKLAKPKPKKK
jgi:hypothetical protein